MSRVFYMSCMTVISQMRTNLPRIHSKVWPNGNGNLGHEGGNKWIGVGGSRSWWWDEALTSMMLALLEPSGRAPTFQFWLGHDDHPGRSKGEACVCVCVVSVHAPCTPSHLQYDCIPTTHVRNVGEPVSRDSIWARYGQRVCDGLPVWLSSTFWIEHVPDAARAAATPSFTAWVCANPPPPAPCPRIE